MLVTLKAKGELLRATAVLPHIENNIFCIKMVDICKDTLKQTRGLTVGVKDAVAEVFGEKLLTNGHVTTVHLANLFAR